MLGENRYKTYEADYKGQVVLLNVWGTFCPPCIVEMPSLQRLYETYRDSGLKIVAVSIDDAVSEDSIAAFARNLGVSFEILHDPTHEIERVLQVTRVSRDVRHRERRHDQEEVDQSRRLELAGQPRADRPTARTRRFRSRPPTTARAEAASE